METKVYDKAILRNNAIDDFTLITEIELRYPIVEIKQNVRGRDYFVGDIHGFLSSFSAGLEVLKFDPENDRVFSVGDLVDRGPRSLDCLRLVNENWFYAVAGNHERLLYKNTKGIEIQKKLENSWQFKLKENEIEECRQLLEKMHWAITVEIEGCLIGVVHADVPRDATWPDYCAKLEGFDRESIECATWSRKLINGGVGQIPGVDVVFVGHQGIEEPTSYNNVVCIDTCVHIPGRYCKNYGLTFAYLKDGKPEYVTINNEK